MFCTRCGHDMAEGTAFCPNCGASSAGTPQPDAAQPPPAYGQPPAYTPPPAYGAPAVAYDPTLRSKLVAGLLGIFVGGLGVHRFYLGYTAIGVAQLALFLVLGIPTCGIGCIAASIWGLIEGILILTGSINQDAQGRPLRD